MPRDLRFVALVFGVGVVVGALSTAVLEAQPLETLTLPASAERGTVVTGVVTLDDAASSGGASVELWSSDESLARVPESVTIPAGARSATFPVRTSPGGAAVSVLVRADRGSVHLDAVLLLPPLSPVRGLGGDRWADVILGKPAFGEITPNRVTASRLFNPGGVLVDRSTRPNRLYVYDGGNSRVLGYSHLGQCSSGGTACTTNGDCVAGTCEILPGRCRSEPDRRCFAGPDCADGKCVVEGTLSADLVLGQPDATRSACNGDGNFQTFPVRRAASASTLCSMPEDQVSTLEGGSFANMAVDGGGNLYVPDWDNHRVLRYDSPFTTDRVADYVWGQADFSGNDCNQDRLPDAKSLCLRSPYNWGFTGGVAVDPSGNLWVADNQNNRVLRFPNGEGGVPSPTADLVLGQNDFHGATMSTQRNGMWSPQAVRVGPDGAVYVLDSQPGGGSALGGRLLVFRAPFSNGMPAAEIRGEESFRNPTGLEIDPLDGGIWINDSSNNQLLLENGARTRVLFKDVPDDSGACGGDYSGDGSLQYDPGNDAFLDVSAACSVYGGIGISDDGDVFVGIASDVQDIWQFEGPFPDPVRGIARSAARRLAVPLQHGVPNHVEAAALASARGVAVFEPAGGVAQLIVADQGRILFWNDLSSLETGKAADGWVGASDADGRPSPRLHVQPNFGRLCADRATRPHLWVLQFDQILGFKLPLTTGAEPVVRISSGLPVVGTAAVLEWTGDLVIGGLAATPDGAQLWVADPRHHRVFRIIDPISENRRVDVLLGQVSPVESECNRGAAAPARNSLCEPGAVALDPSGNVYVADAALEGDGNFRLLEFDAGLFRLPRGETRLGPDASRVFGTGLRYDVPGCQDPLCAPWQPAFASNGTMVVGMNGYGGTRFPLIYETPLESAEPDGYLDDFGSQPYAAAFDSHDNLYLADLNRARVLVYWNPLNIPAAPVQTSPRRPPVTLPSPGNPRLVPRD